MKQFQVNFKSIFNQLSIIFVLLMLFGCNKKQTTITAIPDSMPIVAQMDVPVEKPHVVTVTKAATLNETVYFEFDRSNIRANQVTTLDAIVLKARKAPTKTLRLKGGCSLEGTEAYNLALGYRRGNACKGYLSQYVTNPIVVESVGESDPVTLLEDEIYLNRNCRITLE